MNQHDHLHGCLVLSSKQATSLPLFSRSSLNEHIEGSFNGSVGCMSTFQCNVYDPVRGRSFHAGCSSLLSEESFHGMVSSVGEPSQDTLHGLRDRFHTSANEVSLGSPSVLYLEQRMPFGFIGLHTRHIDLYMFGLFNTRCSVLYWTTVENIEELLRVECPNEFWVYRFRPLRDLSLTMFVKRLCARWYRWNETMPHPAQRFQALEVSLLNSMVCMNV